MRNYVLCYYVLGILVLAACNNPSSKTIDKNEQRKKDSLEQIKKAEEVERLRPRTAQDIHMDVDLTYDQHTLKETYPYKDTTRHFQFEKIKEMLARVENLQREPHHYGVLQNYKNKNKEAPVVEHYVRNAYKRVSDTLGTERYQSAPLYASETAEKPSIYGRDGSVVSIIGSDSADMVKIKGISFEGDWFVPKRYVKSLSEKININHIAFVDVTNQNICLLERTDELTWKIRSMNPATSGQHKPPHAMETPVGIFFIQEQKAKMFYYKDGTTSIEGFAPYASRFTNGAYIHGVPVNNPKGAIVEYSWSLGTTPRSHMCVRNASSHAKFVYDMSKPFESLAIVID